MNSVVCVSDFGGYQAAAIGEPDELIEIVPIEWPSEYPAPVEPATPIAEPVPA